MQREAPSEASPSRSRAAAVWGLPVYELALLTASWLEARGRTDVSIMLTTPEEAPLELFGPEASSATAALLEHRGIEVRTRERAIAFRGGELVLASGETLPSTGSLRCQGS